MSILQTLVTRTKESVTTDPYFSLVDLLLPFDGADGATSTTDESSDSRTVTLASSAQLDTGFSKFGTASLLLNGSSSYCSIPDAAEFEADNSGDITGECWIRAASIKDQAIFSKRTVGTQTGYMFRMLATGVLEFLGWANSSTPSITLTSSAILLINTWYHVAITREGTTWRMFINGNLEDSGTQTAYPTTNSNAFYIGYDFTAVARTFNGHIDEFRWTKGFARYTASFIEPTSAFPRQ